MSGKKLGELKIYWTHMALEWYTKSINSMSMKKLIVGNWKMNLNMQEASLYLHKLTNAWFPPSEQLKW